ncbi:MAG: hypothetical protein IJM37_06305 [Lachnospiraceae bacterium]|nr:hypothetical protein [Lachnospiraceae bacterium]
MEKKLDKNGKTDKGFELIYWNLSYRRKFIRTLWFLPCILAIAAVMIALNILLDVPYVYTAFVVIPLLVIEAAQLIFNYRQWKLEEDD